MTISEEEKQTIKKALRHFSYVIMCIVVIYAMHFGASILKETTFQEDRGTEIGQLGILFVAAVLFFIRAKTSNQISKMCELCGAMCLLGCFRECDRFLDEFIGSWKFGYICPILAVVHCSKSIHSLLDEAKIFVNSSIFLMCCFSLIVILVGELVGHRPFISNVLPNMSFVQVTDIKEFVEEAIEVVGFFILVLAAFECYFIPNKKK